MYNIILGSKSPRRRELLTQIGVKYQVVVSNKEEKITQADPNGVTEELSMQKADYVEEVIEETMDEYIIIAADTVVSRNGKIIGKPADEKDAVETLKMLRGNIHKVTTGVTIIVKNKKERRVFTFSEDTIVKMYNTSDRQIEEYVSTGEPMDKAGSYGIQGMGGKFIEEIKGDYNNVVGLPVAKIYNLLYNLGINICS